MSYAIGYVVYGINLKDEHKFSDDFELLEGSRNLTRHYSGSGDSPRYIGTTLCEFNECRDIPASKLRLDAFSADIQAFKETRDNILADQELSQEFRDYIKNSEPTVFITWGSS